MRGESSLSLGKCLLLLADVDDDDDDDKNEDDERRRVQNLLSQSWGKLSDIHNYLKNLAEYSPGAMSVRIRSV